MTLPESIQDVDDNLLKFELYCKKKQFDIVLKKYSISNELDLKEMGFYDNGYYFNVKNWWKNYDFGGHIFSDYIRIEYLEKYRYVQMSIIFNKEIFPNKQDLQIYMRKCLKQLLEFAGLEDLEDSIFVNQKLINRFFKGRQIINVKGIDNYVRIGLEIRKNVGLLLYHFNIELSPYDDF